MSRYDNDPRVRPDPTCDKSWFVSGHIQGVTYNVYYAYTDDGRLLLSISAADFDTVVHNLIGPVGESS